MTWDRAVRRPAVYRDGVGTDARYPAHVVITMQRLIGNRAVARVLDGRDRGALPIQRCGAEQHPGCPCADAPSDAEAIAVQRSPAYAPNPSWASRGPNNPAGTCEPMGRIKAELAWRYAREAAPSGLTARCGCARVGEAYAMFLDATGGSVVATDPKDCINTQLASEEEAHTAVEDEAKAWLDGKIEDLVRGMGAQDEARMPLFPTLSGDGPHRLVQVTYSRNTLAGGLLFGGGSTDESARDSEHGADTRHLSGEIVLGITDRSDPRAVTVVPELHFHYDVKDALDFCPGNTLLKSHAADPSGDYNQAISTLSNLEASGMARDVRLEAHYDRVALLSPRRVPVNATPPTAFPRTGTARTTGSLLRVRTAPSLTAPTVRLIGERGAEIVVIDQVHGDRVVGSGTTDVWDRVEGGYVSHAYVEFPP